MIQASLIPSSIIPSRGVLHHYLVDGSITLAGVTRFQGIIYTYYNTHKRQFSWRETRDPYHIVVSEIMLQQTQTERVKEKFIEFITAFDSFERLAEARLSEVLFHWQGLGYNRRAQYLHNLAQEVVQNHNGILPSDPQVLRKFKGIGPNTAGSICAFAFNNPTIFIETNIRTVFIHLFYAFEERITDATLLPLITQTVDNKQPREWYYALMDYGVMLKKTVINPSRRSAHHAVQSKFEGSDRQIRGQLLRLLLEYHALSLDAICELIGPDYARTQRIMSDLLAEGLVLEQNGLLSLP